MKLGEQRRGAKLTVANVLDIRGSDESYTALAERFGVSVPVIGAVRSGRTWKHVGGDITSQGHGVAGQRNGQAKLTDVQIAEIRVSPLKQQQLADRYGVSRSLISMIRSGKRWPM